MLLHPLLISWQALSNALLAIQRCEFGRVSLRLNTQNYDALPEPSEAPSKETALHGVHHVQVPTTRTHVTLFTPQLRARISLLAALVQPPAAN